MVCNSGWRFCAARWTDRADQPAHACGFCTGLEWADRFRFAVGVRFFIGAVLIFAAPACAFPTLVRILGAITILAAIIIFAAGRQRLDETIDWWLASLVRVRGSSLFAIVMGVLLVYAAGLP